MKKDKSYPWLRLSINKGLTKGNIIWLQEENVYGGDGFFCTFTGEFQEGCLLEDFEGGIFKIYNRDQEYYIYRFATIREKATLQLMYL